MVITIIIFIFNINPFPLFSASFHSRSKEVLRRPGGVRGRYFLALFDYDPVTMSPNPDALNEELPFKEGQIIKVGGRGSWGKKGEK